LFRRRLCIIRCVEIVCTKFTRFDSTTMNIKIKGKKMIYKLKTHHDITDIRSKLEAKAKEVGFGILGSYEFKKILENKGFPIERDIVVYELCNPAGAQQALSIIPEISVYLPCRLSVYMEDGLTVLATIGVEDILQAVNIDDTFRAYMNEIFEKIKRLMHSLSLA